LTAPRLALCSATVGFCERRAVQACASITTFGSKKHPHARRVSSSSYFVGSKAFFELYKLEDNSWQSRGSPLYSCKSLDRAKVVKRYA
jgi:hypothetical protein